VGNWCNRESLNKTDKVGEKMGSQKKPGCKNGRKIGNGDGKSVFGGDKPNISTESNCLRKRIRKPFVLVAPGGVGHAHQTK